MVVICSLSGEIIRDMSDVIARSEKVRSSEFRPVVKCTPTERTLVLALPHGSDLLEHYKDSTAHVTSD
jgi:hypothetical protein